jgi:hypothetical protein
MPIQIGSSSQTAQEQNLLDKMTREAGNFAQQARRVTSQINDFLRVHQAAGYGASIGGASADEYLTASSDSVTVALYRKMLKAACSYAVVVGELSQAEADALLQEAYGNTDETTVAPENISDLTDQWV